MNGSPPRLDLAVERARRAVVGRLPARRSTPTRTTSASSTTCAGGSARRGARGSPRRTSLNTRSRADLLAWAAGKAGAGVSDVAYHRGAWTTARPGATSRSSRSRVVGPVAAARAAAHLAGRGGAARGDAARHAPGPRRRGRRPSQAWFGVPIESLILPSVAAVACLGAIRLVPFGLWLVPALAHHLVDRRPDARRSRRGSTASDGRLTLGRPDRAAGHDPAGRVPRLHRGRRDGAGRPRPGRRRPRPRATCSSSPPVTRSWPGCSATGRRRCGSTAVRDALWSAATYAAAIAIGAAALRAMEIPRLVGPALLTLAFYLWDAFIGTAPSRRRDLRWIGQIGAARRPRPRRRRLEPAAPRLTRARPAAPARGRRLTRRPDGARKHVRPVAPRDRAPNPLDLLRTPPRPERTTAT